jgi:hypothetical protein
MLNILKTAVATIAFLFGAFNKFFETFSPPPIEHETGDATTANLSIGLVKVVCLVILLFMSLVGNYISSQSKQKLKKTALWWIFSCGVLIVVFVFTALMYNRNFQEKTFTPFGSDRYVRGQLTTEALGICKTDYKGKSLRDCEKELIMDAGAEDMGRYWEPGTREANRKLLENGYIGFVLSFGILVFAICEALGWLIIRKSKLKEQAAMG